VEKSFMGGIARPLGAIGVRIIGRIFITVGLIFSTNLARAESDTLQPITFESVQRDLKKSLSKMSVREDVVPMGCLEGGKDKRTVCNFKIGRILGVMVESKKGEKDVVGITMICSGTEGPADVAKCLLAYTALIGATSPDLDKEARNKILTTLTSGLDVGNKMSIETEERKYVLQKSMGLWFHVIAAESGDD